MKDHNNENYKTLKKAIEEDSRRKDLPWFLISEINAVKMTILQKVSAYSMQSPSKFQ
jgi:hypothetical protein